MVAGHKLEQFLNLTKKLCFLKASHRAILLAFKVLLDLNFLFSSIANQHDYSPEASLYIHCLGNELVTIESLVCKLSQF